jgi:membrane protease YdiL (CAAX protease family)
MVRVRGRILLLQLVLSIALGAFVAYGGVPLVTGRSLPDTLALGVAGVIAYGSLFAFLQWPLRRSGSDLRSVLGPRPNRSTVIWTVLTGAGLLAVSVAATYALFTPLSYVAPEFVSYWLFEDLPEVFWTSGDYRWLGNALNLVLLAVMAPVVEELLFRGLLLPAWTARMGQSAAVVMSSIAFALLHVDVLGSFVFSAVLSVVFLRTGRLWLPILIHAANNALVWVLHVTGLAFGWQWLNTVGDLQSTWWYGPIALAVGLPLLILMLRRIPARDDLPAPVPATEVALAQGRV